MRNKHISTLWVCPNGMRLWASLDLSRILGFTEVHSCPAQFWWRPKEWDRGHQPDSHWRHLVLLWIGALAAMWKQTQVKPVLTDDSVNNVCLLRDPPCGTSFFFLRGPETHSMSQEHVPLGSHRTYKVSCTGFSFNAICQRPLLWYSTLFCG